MTSRRELFEGRSRDDLDGLVCWALRERVAGATPPPWMWDRICLSAEKPTAWRLVRWWLKRGYWAAVVVLSELDALLVGCDRGMPSRRECIEWHYDPWLARLLDQYCFMLKLAC